jgi:putative signal transducing protein
MTGDLNEAASYCPQCGAEYREGFDVCADDGTTLIPGPAPADLVLPPEPVIAPEPEGPPSPPANWVRVAAFPDEKEARVLAGLLQTARIEARVYPEFQGNFYGEGIMVPVQVLVPEHQAAEARQLVDQLEQS